MARKLYEVKFKVKGRGNKVFTWLWWHENVKAAREYANKTISREYPQGHKIVSIKLSKQPIHEFSKKR